MTVSALLIVYVSGDFTMLYMCEIVCTILMTEVTCTNNIQIIIQIAQYICSFAISRGCLMYVLWPLKVH